MSSERATLLVLADSLAYYGPQGGLAANDPRIWPNIVARELDMDVELVARIGWTARDMWWAITQDPRVWASVPTAKAVIFAVGGMDTLPSPLPTALRELIRYVRPPELRRRVREAYGWLQPRLAPLGWPVALPPALTVDYLEQSRAALTQLRPDVPVIATLPSVHIADSYGRIHAGRPAAETAIRAWAGEHDVPLVDLAAAVSEHIFAGRSNPDGIHWNFEGHEAVARLMIAALSEAGVRS